MKIDHLSPHGFPDFQRAWWRNGIPSSWEPWANNYSLKIRPRSLRLRGCLPLIRTIKSQPPKYFFVRGWGVFGPVWYRLQLKNYDKLKTTLPTEIEGSQVKGETVPVFFPVTEKPNCEHEEMVLRAIDYAFALEKAGDESTIIDIELN